LFVALRDTDVDARHKAGHDERESSAIASKTASKSTRAVDGS
jgi:hypothetical protein